MREPMQHNLSDQMRQCIEDCQECHSLCWQVAARYLRPAQDVKSSESYIEPTYLRLLLDCAEICQTSANFMLRGSDWYRCACQMCLEVCDQCARECEKVTDDAQMQACAEVCRHCADSCQEEADLEL